MRVPADTFSTLLDQAITAAVHALALLQQLDSDGHKFEKRTFHPQFDEIEPGPFRRIRDAYSADRLARYSSVFGKVGNWGVKHDVSELAGYEDLVTVVREHEDLAVFLGPSHLEPDHREHVLQLQVADLPLKMAARNIAMHRFEPNLEVLQETGTALLNWWSWDDLPIDVIIPILNITFEGDRFELSNGARVEQMSDDMKLASWPGHPRINKYNDFVTMATHCLVIPGWSMPSWFRCNGYVFPTTSPWTTRPARDSSRRSRSSLPHRPGMSKCSSGQLVGHTTSEAASLRWSRGLCWR